MALNGINFDYTVKNGNLTVSYIDKNGNQVTKTGKDAAEMSSIFTDNQYTEDQAAQIISNLLDSKSYDKDGDGTLTDAELEEALNAGAGAGTAPTTGPGNAPGASGTGVDGEQPTGVDGQQPDGTTTTEETERSQYKNKTNADLAATQGDAQKNYDTSKEDMNTAKTGVSDAKEAYGTTKEEQDKLVEEAENALEYKHENYDEIKEKYGEEIAKALDDVKSKQEAENEAQNKVDTCTTAVADATTAVSEATSAVDEANGALTEAQAALDSAPMFIETGKTDENGQPVMAPNPELPALQQAVEAAEEAVKEAEEALAEKKEALTKAEEELKTAETALDEAVAARDESQKAYEETVKNSEFAEDEALKAITEAVKGVSEAQNTRKETMDTAKEAVTTATNTLKETSDKFNNNQKAINEINREVNERKAKGIWDTTSDKTPEEIEAEEKAEEAKETDEAEDKEEGEEGEEKDEEEIPDKGNAADLKAEADKNSNVVTYAMVKDELRLAEQNNVDLKNYVYAKGQDGVYHLYNGQSGTSIAREFGAKSKSGLGLSVWGGGYDIVGSGSGYLYKDGIGGKKLTGTVYSYGETPDTIKASEEHYSTDSPLSFDLDGNGINTSDEMISFDIDGDGLLDNIYNSADAVLVFDADGNGISGEDGSECFGNNTNLDIDGDGKPDEFADGFAALKALAQKEGLVGENDTTLDEGDLKKLEEKYGLKMKANGYNSEASSLFDLGITSINLSDSEVIEEKNFDGEKGNNIMRQQGATFEINGEEREYADIWHRYLKH